MNLLIENIGGYEAFVFYDEENGQYTVCYSGNGGAVMSDKSLVKAINKFKEGMQVAYAVKKLLSFRK